MERNKTKKKVKQTLQDASSSVSPQPSLSESGTWSSLCQSRCTLNIYEENMCRSEVEDLPIGHRVYRCCCCVSIASVDYPLVVAPVRWLAGRLRHRVQLIKLNYVEYLPRPCLTWTCACRKNVDHVDSAQDWSETEAETWPKAKNIKKK